MKVPVWSRTIHNSGAVGTSQVNRSTKCRHRRRGGAGDSDGKRRATVSRSSSTRARHGPAYDATSTAETASRRRSQQRVARNQQNEKDREEDGRVVPMPVCHSARLHHGPCGDYNGNRRLSSAAGPEWPISPRTFRLGLRSEAVFGETGPRSPNTASRSRVHQVCFRHPDPAETRPGTPIESVRY